MRVLVPLPQVKYEKWSEICYVCKDGTQKTKKDFVEVNQSFTEWQKEMEEYWASFIKHHNDARWHDDDFVHLRTMLGPGQVGAVIDFAQNYSHEPRFEHVSQYFSQVCADQRASSLPCTARCRCDVRALHSAFSQRCLWPTARYLCVHCPVSRCRPRSCPSC